MRIAIVSLPGAESSQELALAISRAEMEVLHFSKETPREQLSQADGYIVVSGPDINEIMDKNSPLSSLLTHIKTQAAKGKPLLGIGAGAGILVKTGLVPGLPDHRQALMLVKNVSMTEEKTASTLEVKLRLSKDYQYNAFTRYLTPHHILSCSLSTPEGRFMIPPGLLIEIEAQGLNIFCYCNEKGEILSEPTVNPTGSINNIAAIANKAGNVMAMIPHPEKTLEGDAIFLSMRDHIASGYVAELAPLDYWPRQ